jgi:hypothetical protein
MHSTSIHRHSHSFRGEMPRVDRRQERQHERIRDGVESGQINPAEARALRWQQAGIRARERIAEADGVVTPRERAHLDRLQDATSASIFIAKHNIRV